MAMCVCNGEHRYRCAHEGGGVGVDASTMWSASVPMCIGLGGTSISMCVDMGEHRLRRVPIVGTSLSMFADIGGLR